MSNKLTRVGDIKITPEAKEQALEAYEAFRATSDLELNTEKYTPGIRNTQAEIDKTLKELNACTTLGAATKVARSREGQLTQNSHHLTMQISHARLELYKNAISAYMTGLMRGMDKDASKASFPSR